MLRRSEPSASAEVTGGTGSTQSARTPPLAKAAAAVSPATPPPATSTSVSSRSITLVRSGTPGLPT